MNHYEVLHGIAEFAEFGEAIVIKQADWEMFASWVKSLPEDVLTDRPNFDILPIAFEKHA